MTDLSPLEIDTISEVGNISLGSSATALSAIINKRVSITTPRLEVLTAAAVTERFPAPCVVAAVTYTAGLRGSNVFLIKDHDARVIAALMIGSSEVNAAKPLEEIEISAIEEAMNQMMGQMATAMSEMFQRQIIISPPLVELRKLEVAEPALWGLREDDKIVEVAFNLAVEDLIDSTLVQLIPLESAREMVSFLLGEEASFEEPGNDPLPAKIEPPPQEKSDRLPLPDEPLWEEAGPPRQVSSGARSLPAEKRLDDAAALEKLELVKELPIDVTVILGGTRISLGKLFDLEKGGIINLDGYIDAPVELMVNGKVMAYGEVVMIDEYLGVRITRMEAGPAPEQAGFY